MVYSENAKESGLKNLEEVRGLLEDISILMGSYESLKRWDYSYVGDTAHVKEQLYQIKEFLCGTEEGRKI